MDSWNLNLCRIIYVLDETGAPQFGFANGMLEDRIERGKKLFLADWDHVNQAVQYGIRYFSRPQHTLATLGLPYIRWHQRKVCEFSGIGMHNFVARFCVFASAINETVMS